jgi:hypothetical protein
MMPSKEDFPTQGCSLRQDALYTVLCAWHKLADVLKGSLEAFTVEPLVLNALNPSYHSNGSSS